MNLQKGLRTLQYFLTPRIWKNEKRIFISGNFTNFQTKLNHVEYMEANVEKILLVKDFIIKYAFEIFRRSFELIKAIIHLYFA